MAVDLSVYLSVCDVAAQVYLGIVSACHGDAREVGLWWSIDRYYLSQLNKMLRDNYSTEWKSICVSSGLASFVSKCK